MRDDEIEWGEGWKVWKYEKGWWEKTGRRGREKGKVKRKMPRVNQEEGSLRMSRGERENIPQADLVFSCVCVSLYIYIYKISKRMLPWKEVGVLSKNDCTFRGSARSRGISDGRSRFHGYIRYTPWWKLYAWNEKITQFISAFIHPLFVPPLFRLVRMNRPMYNVAEHFSPVLFFLSPFSLS